MEHVLRLCPGEPVVIVFTNGPSNRATELYHDYREMRGKSDDTYFERAGRPCLEFDGYVKSNPKRQDVADGSMTAGEFEKAYKDGEGLSLVLFGHEEITVEVQWKQVATLQLELWSEGRPGDSLDFFKLLGDRKCGFRECDIEYSRRWMAEVDGDLAATSRATIGLLRAQCRYLRKRVRASASAADSQKGDAGALTPTDLAEALRGEHRDKLAKFTESMDGVFEHALRTHSCGWHYWDESIITKEVLRDVLREFEKKMPITACFYKELHVSPDMRDKLDPDGSEMEQKLLKGLMSFAASARILTSKSQP